jgi:hypothetical protein
MSAPSASASGTLRALARWLFAWAPGPACAAARADTGAATRGRTAAAPDGYPKAHARRSTNPDLALCIAQAQFQLKQPAEAQREFDALLAAPATEPQVPRQASDLLTSVRDEQTR